MNVEENETLISSRSRRSQSAVSFKSIGEMESVVATVSGYHGSERFDLIKLISLTGANYVGVMSSSITHLVCRKLEGKKVNLAYKFNIIIVSHCWFEDCVKAGKRIPADPYVLHRDQEIGPLQTVGLLLVKEVAPLTERPRKVLLDLSDLRDDSEGPIANAKGGTSSHRVCLFNESLFPESCAKSKRKEAISPADEGKWSPPRYFKGSSPSADVKLKGESSSRNATRSVRRKKDTFDAVQSTTSTETFRRGRRLVKRNISPCILVHDLSDSEQVYDSVENNNPHATIRPPSSCPEAGITETLLISGGNSPVEPHVPARSGDDSEYASANVEGIEGSDAQESLSGDLKTEDPIENITRLPASMELSCVICWTDFSSTRGVLPCGHRFCYSCIQNWADHMVSMRKSSTCPLCKASFVSITKFDDTNPFDQKIYSQTIPRAVSTSDIYILPHRETAAIGAQSSMVAVCSVCQYREPEDLLISCHGCHIRCIHSYCLDPPLLPWTCFHCKDSRTLFFNQFR